MVEWTIIAMALVAGFCIGALAGMMVTARKLWVIAERRNQPDYAAASEAIQNIVRGACLDPEIRAKAAAAGKSGHVLDSRLGGHWAGRILAAAGIKGRRG